MNWHNPNHQSYMPNPNFYPKLNLNLILIFTLKPSTVDRYNSGPCSIMLTQSSNNPTVVIWCNAVQYIDFPIKSESVSWWLHKVMRLEANSSLTAATKESFVLIE